eukprot:CAMPEP_0171330800 /NCGR_PEP_ID=MMETSP0878-20121228/2253_1 /TAXON_ID=67004 /ORGANISM="Thalassiosira weissflogii, Strain CCMP1336" /LENGTH=239 /DNA_ID=CAMNT_0011831177 /DNA_START=70 /DNA_END=789 /DNA_ORIENTATION=-
MTPISKLTHLFILITIAALSPIRCLSFRPISKPDIGVHRRSKTPLSASPSPISPPPNESSDKSASAGKLAHALASQRRRALVTKTIAYSLGFLSISSIPKNNDKALAVDVNELVGQLKQARDQLNEVPELIKAEKWDAVRAILIKPPLSDLWTSGGSKKVLNDYADAIDEIEALELREDLISHLRYLDMAVYNNVFNPIATEGTSGATKELVRSYYEDPILEWKATMAALDALIGLGSL